VTDAARRPLRGLRGRRVYLRPLEPEDADTVSAGYDDARVATLMGDQPISHAQRRTRYEHASSDGEDDGFRFMICRLEDDVPVGRTDLFELDRGHGSCALGITIGDPADWGRGYGSDALDALMDFAFGQLRLERVWLDTETTNARAQAAYRKAGFEVEGTLRRAWFQDGVWKDDLRMALLRDRWLELDRPRSWDLVEEAAKPDGS
jgi:RimJ/RimL family protein N-acetyltransferase